MSTSSVTIQMLSMIRLSLTSKFHDANIYVCSKTGHIS